MNASTASSKPSNVKIFKLVSGELIIARVEGQFDLHTAHSFEAVSPMILQFNGQGFGFAPIFPWCEPKSGVSATFYGATVAMVAKDSDPCHEEFVRNYRDLTSVVSLDTSMLSNVRPLR